MDGWEDCVTADPALILCVRARWSAPKPAAACFLQRVRKVMRLVGFFSTRERYLPTPGASDDVSVGNILDTCQLVAKCV